jgi:hypothetical protein
VIIGRALYDNRVEPQAALQAATAKLDLS